MVLVPRLRGVLRIAATALLLVALKERRLLMRRPSFIHALELAIFLSGLLVGWGLRAVHVATRPLKGWQLMMRGRAALLEYLNRLIKARAPSLYDMIHKHGAMPPPGARITTISEEGGTFIDYKADGIDAVSFSGCAWLLMYHLGVAEELMRHQVLNPDRTVLLGSSSGSIMAAALAAGVDLEVVRAFIVDMAIDSQERVLGPVGRMSHYVGTGLESLLPHDALQRIGHRLRVSVTRLHAPGIGQPDDALDIEEEAVVVGSGGGGDGGDAEEQWKVGVGVANRLIGRFRSRQDLIETLLSSCYIPVYYERPTVVGRHLGLDGGASDNLPILPDDTRDVDGDDDTTTPGGRGEGEGSGNDRRRRSRRVRTVTVSPYPGEAVICPPADKAFPGHYSLFPPSPPELDRIHTQGRQDALTFLSTHSLLLTTP